MAEIEAARNLTLTPVEMQTNRWYCEQERLRLFRAFALISSSGRIVAAEGVIDTQNGNTYGVRIALEGFPDTLPKVFPRGWELHPDAPHKFGDGSMCIMRSDQWRRYFTVALVVSKTAISLGKYEIWKRNGHVWPGLQQRH